MTIGREKKGLKGNFVEFLYERSAALAGDCEGQNFLSHPLHEQWIIFLAHH